MLLQGNGARMTLFTPQAVYVRTKHLGEEFADSMKAQQSTHLKTMQFHYQKERSTCQPRDVDNNLHGHTVHENDSRKQPVSISSKTDEEIFGCSPTVKYYEADEMKSMYQITSFFFKQKIELDGLKNIRLVDLQISTVCETSVSVLCVHTDLQLKYISCDVKNLTVNSINPYQFGQSSESTLF